MPLLSRLSLLTPWSGEAARVLTRVLVAHVRTGGLAPVEKSTTEAKRKMSASHSAWRHTEQPKPSRRVQRSSQRRTCAKESASSLLAAAEVADAANCSSPV